jgi:drug/metabolite transporter (DMT)-like permease
MQTTTRHSYLATAMLFGAALIWGSSFIMMKHTVNSIPTNLLLAFRFLVGCLLLSAIFPKHLRKLSEARYWWQGALLGVLLFTAYNIQTAGVIRTTAGKNAFLTCVYCLFVPFFNWFLTKRKPDRYNLSSAVLCLVGIALVSLEGDLSINTGDLLTLAGGVFWALHIICVGKFTQDGDPILYTIVQFGTAAILALAFGFITETVPTTISATDLFSLFYLAVFATTIALLLQNLGQARTTPAAASIILSLEAVFGVLFSVLAGGEVLTLRLSLGFAVICVSVCMSEPKLSFFSKRKSTRPSYAQT